MAVTLPPTSTSCPLTVDVLRLFIDHLAAIGASRTLSSLQLCSKDLYQLVTPVLYRHVVLSSHSFEKLFVVLTKLSPNDLRGSTARPSSRCPSDQPTSLEHASAVRSIDDFRPATAPRRLIQHLAYTRRLKLTFEIPYQTSHPLFTPIHSLIYLVKSTTGQGVFPNVKAVAFAGTLSEPLTPGTMMDLVARLSQPKYLCTHHVRNQAARTATDDDPVDFGEISDEFEGGLERTVYHDVDPDFMVNLHRGRPTVSFRQHPCLPSCTNVRAHWEDTCEIFHRDKQLYKLLYALSRSDDNDEEREPFVIVQGREETSQPERELKKLRVQFGEELDRLEKRPKGGYKGLFVHEYEREKLGKGRRVRWVLGDGASGEPPCPACGDPI